MAEASANDVREQVLAMAYLAVFLLSIVVLLCWIYRTNRNLRPLDVRGIEFTPGWAVGWWFVPFLNDALSNAVHLVAAALLIAIVVTIGRRQNERYARLEAKWPIEEHEPGLE